MCIALSEMAILLGIWDLKKQIRIVLQKAVNHLKTQRKFSNVVLLISETIFRSLIMTPEHSIR